jgi:hypothetical protein
VIAALAVLALPVAFLAGGVAVYSIRSGEMRMAVKAGAVFAFCALLYLAAPKSYPTGNADCFTDWDGRSNPVVCN